MEENKRVFEVTIHLKSGAAVVFDSTVITTKRNQTTNELTGLEWNTPGDTEAHTYRRLSYIRLDDISAIVVY